MRAAFILVLTTIMAMFILPCNLVNAQIYKFQQFDVTKGICHHSIYAITQDKHGFIWFATGMGLCRYDGFRFVSPNADLPSSNATTAFRDNKGNLWFGYNDGLVVQYDGFDFAIADTSRNSTSINQIIQAPRGEILVATQSEGITRINGKRIERLSLGTDKKLIYSLCLTTNNKLLVGCRDGLYLYDYKDSLTYVTQFDNIPDATIQTIIPRVDGKGYWVATLDEGIYNVTIKENDFEVTPLDIPMLEDCQVQSMYEDAQNNLWISTYGKGLVRVHLLPDATIDKVFSYNSSNGLGSNLIKQVFFDNQQNLWVATYGQGVACITNLAISFFENIEPISNNATAISSVDNSEYWIAGIGAIVRYSSDPKHTTTKFGRAEGIPNDKITALHQDKKGDLWIGTEKNGLYKLTKGAKAASPAFKSENSLSNAIQAITSFNDKIWFATRNGVLNIDTQTGKMEHLNMFDGGLPHNNIRDIFKDSKNAIWIATNSNSIVSVNSGRKLTLEDEAETEFSTITEDDQGRLWAGTNGKGVYIFDQTNDTIYHIMPVDGLKSEYCYAIAYDGKDHVWVGHRLGMSRINIDRFTVTTLGNDNGITGDVNPNAMVMNNSGELLVGMTNGVMEYNMSADHTQDQIPMLNLAGIAIGDVSYNPGKPITLPYKSYKVQFDFIGLQYSNPESVTYQYRLLGYDSEWSKPSKTNTVIYPRLEDGEWRFWVRACNSDNCTEETMLYVIKIKKPFWKTWGFIFLCIGAAVGAVYAIIIVRERNHRIQQEHLERELAARTKEVREQKEEIENKNRDITDSINYAQRIQFSVLPSTSTLLEQCSGAFIFYRPRDIVSGDFYWFDYFPETHRLLIVCADSTGHGVPGAFMSLIGTTLIKDIAMRPDVLDPSDILYRLDENVQSTLNQNQDSEHANDGMDIIVCEINTETHYARIASAMRPYVIYQNGVPTTYKCSRSSIGGQRVENKVFDMTEIQLSVGDIIYMFTDGYADQFGGPSGKKFKMNRLQSILDDIHARDMDEQLRVIKENFDLWKGALNQVDDVLMIGVKI